MAMGNLRPTGREFIGGTVQWDQVIGSLVGSGPLAGGLAFALWMVWNKSNARIAELEARLKASQDARITDLKSMLRPED